MRTRQSPQDFAQDRVHKTIKGIKGIVLTKLDVLDDFDEIKVCVKYELDGKEIDCDVIYDSAMASLKNEFAEIINSKELFSLVT